MTYLIDAVQIGYSPELDPTTVGQERVAMLRCLFYGDCSFWVPPTVQAEYRLISNAEKRDTHNRWTRYHLQDMPLSTEARLLDARARELSANHSSSMDCRVVAEAEASGLKTLLTSDADLIARLAPKATIQIMRPTQYWDSLAIRRGADPIVRPADENPLALADWWRWR